MKRLSHQQAWELIPWYVNDTLDAAEAEAVDDHLERCPLCRREVVANRRLALAVLRSAGEGVPRSPRHGGERLLAGGAAERRGSRRAAPGVRRWWWAPAAALAASLAVALLVPAWLGGAVAPAEVSPSEAAPPPSAAFRTLTSPSAVDAAGGAAVRLVFAAGMSEGAIRRLLLAEEGRFVAGPSPAGVYTAVFPVAGGDEAVDTLLARLRAAPAVALAERLHAAAAADAGDAEGDG